MSGVRNRHMLQLRAWRPILYFPLAMLIACVVAGCGMPRDPEGTLERVRGGILRAGISENEPWTRIEGDRLSGVEVRLLRDFARELNARIEWVQGSDAKLLEALKFYRLDVVVAGLTYDSPWAAEVGMTQPYYTSVLTIGTPPNSPHESADTLEGRRVGVPVGRAAGGYAEEAGAIAVPVADLSSYPGLVAAYPWQLKRWGFHKTGVSLHESEQVMAVPLGENAWLVQLEGFILPRVDAVHSWLVGEAP